MTLDRHRSKLIPDVVYSGDGTVFVTDREGTFPLRHAKNEKQDVRDLDYSREVESFRSFDPKRDNQRRYKQRASISRYGQEIQTLSGTVSTQSSHSLARKLRRSKSFSRKQDPVQQYGTLSASTGGSTSRGRRLRGDTPKITPEFAASLREKRERAEAKRRALEPANSSPYASNGSLGRRRGSKGSLKNGSANGHGKLPLLDDPMNRHRKIHQESLPYAVFLVDGVLLLILGVARLVLVYWHEYFSALWTGLIMLVLGIVGARHKAQYLATGKNVGYVLLACVAAVAGLVAAWLVLKVLVPMLYLLILDKNPGTLPLHVTFSSWGNTTLTGIDLDEKLVTWVGLALDVSTLVLLLVGFYSLTAAMIAFGNYWDAAFDTTADCDHRGNPRFFNPIEQMILGLALTFVGEVAVVVIDSLDHDQRFPHYYSPLWAGIAVILAGFASTCFGKRPDKSCWGAMALLLQLLALAACSGACVLMTLGLADNLRKLVKGGLEGREHGVLVASLVSRGLYMLLMIIGLIFLCGVLFRVTHKLCCARCTLDAEPSQPKLQKERKWVPRDSYHC